MQNTMMQTSEFSKTGLFRVFANQVTYMQLLCSFAYQEYMYFMQPYVIDALTFGDGVKKERADLTVASNESLFRYQLLQKSDKHPEGNTHILGLTCPHIDTEQLTMAHNILQTTFTTTPYCKVTYASLLFLFAVYPFCTVASGNKLVYILCCCSDQSVNKCQFIICGACCISLANIWNSCPIKLSQ